MQVKTFSLESRRWLAEPLQTVEFRLSDGQNQPGLIQVIIDAEIYTYSALAINNPL